MRLEVQVEDMFGNAISGFVATIITIPLFGWYLVYIVCVKISHNKRYSVKLATDVTTFLFILAVYFIAYEIWQKSFLWLILIIILLVASMFTIIHWKVKNEINTLKLIKGIWRFNFLLFLIGYLLLCSYGLIMKIYTI
ncbi:DUF3397 domain-containing protein [Anaerobacillus sp. MEB173]|uniref:DUF3397 domain-containing protein n=1 Tax=Anaerobacillus sp. MEB173 TaxID=3383345 RepID=UPI003F903B36